MGLETSYDLLHLLATLLESIVEVSSIGFEAAPVSLQSGLGLQEKIGGLCLNRESLYLGRDTGSPAPAYPRRVEVSDSRAYLSQPVQPVLPVRRGPRGSQPRPVPSWR